MKTACLSTMLILVLLLGACGGDPVPEQINSLEYQVLEKTTLKDGKTYTCVLVASLSPWSSADLRERTLRRIQAEMQVFVIDLYRTREAYRAMNDSGYSADHPMAIERGFLGELRNGVYFHQPNRPGPWIPFWRYFEFIARQ